MGLEEKKIVTRISEVVDGGLKKKMKTFCRNSQYSVLDSNRVSSMEKPMSLVLH
jgi:hypothetical protein